MKSQGGVIECGGGEGSTDLYTAKGDSLREQPGQHGHWIALSGMHAGNVTSKVFSTKPGMVALTPLIPSMQEVDAGAGLQSHSQ